MALTLKFQNDAFPPGTVFALEGIGAIKNGEAMELTEEQEHGFVAAHRILVSDSVADSDMWEVTGTPSVTSVKDSLGVDPAEISFEAVPTLVEEPTDDKTVEEPTVSTPTLTPSVETPAVEDRTVV
jgi:hypothetical protein